MDIIINHFILMALPFDNDMTILLLMLNIYIRYSNINIILKKIILLYYLYIYWIPKKNIMSLSWAYWNGIKIYLIANTSAYCIKSNFQPFLNRSFDAYSPFLAHMNHYSPLPQCLQNLPQVYGGLVGWNQSPRRFDHHIRDYSPEQLQKNTANDLLTMSGDCSTSPQIYCPICMEWMGRRCNVRT